jgi:hypothetical protein
MIWLLVFGYVLLAALVLNLTVSGGWPTFAKIGAIVVVTACYWLSYTGFRATEGWPTRNSLPTDFRLHWVTVEEPDKVTSSEGAIYFWVTMLDTEGRPAGPPRAHRLPFDAETSAAAEAALNRLNEGEPLNGYLSRQLMDPTDAVDNTEDRRITQGELSLTDGGAQFRLEFREVPLPDLPAKTLPGS